MKKLYIFDLDGTLVDSLQDLAESTNLVLAIHGFPTHPVEAYKRFIGGGAYNLMQRTLPEENRDEGTILACKAQFDVIYDERCFCNTKPYDGALELLSYCKEQGALCAVLSNKPDDFTQQIAKRLFPEGCFDLVLGQRDDLPKKPDPTAVEYILNTLGVAKEDALMMGDSDVDIITCQNAGISSVGACWGFRGKEELADAGADILVDSLGEYLALLKKEKNS